MASDSEQQTQQLQTRIEAAVELRDRDLVTRPEWDPVGFGAAEGDLERGCKALTDSSIIRVENLTDGAVKTITAKISAFVETLRAIDEFSHEQANPKETRDTVVAQVHQPTDDLNGTTTPWMPYLPYLRGTSRIQRPQPS
jgi:hypothetical protein